MEILWPIRETVSLGKLILRHDQRFRHFGPHVSQTLNHNRTQQQGTRLSTRQKKKALTWEGGGNGGTVRLELEGFRSIQVRGLISEFVDPMEFVSRKLVPVSPLKCISLDLRSATPASTWHPDLPCQHVQCIN